MDKEPDKDATTFSKNKRSRKQWQKTSKNNEGIPNTTKCTGRINNDKKDNGIASNLEPVQRHRYKSWGNASFFSEEAVCMERALGHHNSRLSNQLSYRKLSILLKSADLPDNRCTNWSRASFALKQSDLRERASQLLYNDPKLSNQVIIQKLAHKNINATVFPKIWSLFKGRTLINKSGEEHSQILVLPKGESTLDSDSEASGIRTNKTNGQEATDIEDELQQERRNVILEGPPALCVSDIANPQQRARRNSCPEGQSRSRVDSIKCTDTFDHIQRVRSNSLLEGSARYSLKLVDIAAQHARSDSLVPESPARYLVDSIGAIYIDFLEETNNLPNEKVEIPSLPKQMTIHKHKRSRRGQTKQLINDKRASTLVVGFDDLELGKDEKNAGFLSNIFGRFKTGSPTRETPEKQIPALVITGEEKNLEKSAGSGGITVNSGQQHAAEVFTDRSRQHKRSVYQPKNQVRYREDSIGGVDISFFNPTLK